MVTAPTATLALLTGAYLATVRGYWEELWVSLPLSLLIFLLSAQGAFLAPTERRLEALAESAFAGGGGPEREAEYGAVARRYAIVVYVMCAAVVAAVAVMVTKVGG